MAAVRIENLSKRYGGTPALEAVDLQVEAGEICFLLGPSGCGKTTLLRAVAGFAEPDEGRIWLGEKEVTRMPAHLRGAALMFQNYALWPHLTVARNVAFGLEEQRAPKTEIARRVGEMLELMRLGELAERRIHELSGGQQQRVALARALAVRPRCLLLDEPLSNLDTRLRIEMRGEIRRLCKEAGLTAIYVSHDQKEALSIGDRLAVMLGGRICQVGRPEEVYRGPRSRFVAEFLGETNLIEGHAENGAISTPAGMLKTDAETRPGPVLVSIRPEAWRLAAQPDGAANAWPGRIEETAYLGEMARHRFRAAAGRDLTIYELNPRSRAGGGECFAIVDPADVVPIPEP